MIVVKHGRREMQLAWTHLLPATFGGRARMNVQNSLAAAAAAFAAGAPLHDIRQGLRTFSTSYYLSPGRLNEVEVNGVQVIVDYCHNAPGMRMLGDFVDRLGDEPDAAASELGRPLADRRDRHRRRPARRRHARARCGRRAALRRRSSSARTQSLRGRERGETAALVAEGVRTAMADGARCKQVEIVLDEIDAVRHAHVARQPGRPGRRLRRQAPGRDGRAGDLVQPGPGRLRAEDGPGRRPGLHPAPAHQENVASAPATSAGR